MQIVSSSKVELFCLWQASCKKILQTVSRLHMIRGTLASLQGFCEYHGLAMKNTEDASAEAVYQFTVSFFFLTNLQFWRKKKG
jgi:hypothetical protein|mmetsp:Transcript_97659/g.164439  ORF Transcript_97659/g.164439 Transcript_97659/m.164439 type:complete len:83 (+) Transcript_97659:1240-1488(+)